MITFPLSIGLPAWVFMLTFANDERRGDRVCYWSEPLLMTFAVWERKKA